MSLPRCGQRIITYLYLSSYPHTKLSPTHQTFINFTKSNIGHNTPFTQQYNIHTQVTATHIDIVINSQQPRAFLFTHSIITIFTLAITASFSLALS